MPNIRQQKKRVRTADRQRAAPDDLCVGDRGGDDEDEQAEQLAHGVPEVARAASPVAQAMSTAAES